MWFGNPPNLLLLVYPMPPTPLRLTLLLLLLLARPVTAKDTSPGEAPPDEQATTMKRVAAALNLLFASLPPSEVTSKIDENSVEILFRPQTFTVHGHSMTGEFSKGTHQEVGPSYKGLVLRISRQQLGLVNQAVTPQTIQEPYWTTDLDITPLKSADCQLFWALSYGARPDPKLLAAVRNALHHLQD